MTNSSIVNVQQTATLKAEALTRPSADEEAECVRKTQLALNNLVSGKANAARIKQQQSSQEPRYIQYTPKEGTPGMNPAVPSRTIRMVDKHIDPMEPPKFKHKRVPRGPPEAPVPILHDPVKKLTAQDQADWKIPPCVSNWKNRSGMTIPLDKRLAADGRRLQDLRVNEERFSSVTQALQIAEETAREEIKIRNDMLKQRKKQDEEKREEKLKDLAAQSRSARINAVASEPNRGSSSSVPPAEEPTDQLADERSKRRELEGIRKRELERDFRMEKSGVRAKRMREADREVSERVALGQPQPTSQEALFDARLFNQTAGMDTGFDGGDDEKNVAYDRPLFADRSKAGIYQYEQERLEQNSGITSVPSFAGAEADNRRDAPVQFEKEKDDPFGLSTLLEDVGQKPSS